MRRRYFRWVELLQGLPVRLCVAQAEAAESAAAKTTLQGFRGVRWQRRRARWRYGSGGLYSGRS